MILYTLTRVPVVYLMRVHSAAMFVPARIEVLIEFASNPEVPFDSAVPLLGAV